MDFANRSFAGTDNTKPTKERHSYENEYHGHQRNHRGDTIKMDATGADDAGDPRHDARRNRLP